jgi:signal transduction histidine kinase
MEQMLEPVDFGEPVRGRAKQVAETLAALHGPSERPEELVHDARNMVTALELYCGLLEENGVLSAAYRHYASELRLVAQASRRLVEKLSTFDLPGALRRDGCARAAGRGGGQDSARRSVAFGDEIPAAPAEDLAGELETKRNLLAALAGPGIELTLRVQGGRLPVELTREDLTRVLVNLVKNSVEAMTGGGRIEIGLDEFHAANGEAPWLLLSVEDTGPGISGGRVEEIFQAGYTTWGDHGWAGRRAGRRGLGLSITRAIVEAAGGRVFAANRAKGGTRIQIELPVRKPVPKR